MAKDLNRAVGCSCTCPAEDLRKDMQRTRRICFVATSVSVVLLALANVGIGDEEIRADVVRTKRLVVEDISSDRAVALIHSRAGCGVLELRGDGTHRRVEMNGGSGGTGARQSGLFFFDASGDARFQLEVGAGGNDPVTMELSESFRKETGSYPARILCLVRDGKPALCVFDGKGTQVGRLPELGVAPK